MNENIFWLIIGILGVIDSRAGFAGIAIYAAIKLAGMH